MVAPTAQSTAHRIDLTKTVVESLELGGVSPLLSACIRPPEAAQACTGVAQGHSMSFYCCSYPSRTALAGAEVHNVDSSFNPSQPDAYPECHVVPAFPSHRIEQHD